MDCSEREYEFTIANRGATGWWRDTWGNEARSLLDSTIRTVRAVSQAYLIKARWIPDAQGWGRVLDPEWTRSDEAHAMLAELRMARATIRGDRSGYERATAELRAVFEMVATIVVGAALSAVIGPLAAQLVGLGELAEGAAVTLRFVKWVETTTAGIVSNVTANKIVYGSSYGWEQLKRDLAGGFGGAIGTVALEKLGVAVAAGLVKQMGSKAPPELIKVASGTFGGMVGTSTFTEGDPLKDLTFTSYMTNVLQGKASSALETGFKKGFGTEHLGKQGRWGKPADEPPAGGGEPTTTPPGSETAPAGKRPGTGEEADPSSARALDPDAPALSPADTPAKPSSDIAFRVYWRSLRVRARSRTVRACAP